MSDDTPADKSASNSLGLDLEALKIKDDPDYQASVEKPPSSAGVDAKPEGSPTLTRDDAQDEPTTPSGKKDVKGKSKPYVNPDRFKTGGEREKPTDSDLADRMTRIREINERIKERRKLVEADEEEYNKTRAEELAKKARAMKIQMNVNKAREENAARKMKKVEAREWDLGKSAVRDKPKTLQPQRDEAVANGEKKQSIGIRGGVRGGGRGGGRGRGRGGGVASPTSEKPANTGESEQKDTDASLTVQTADSSAPQEAVATGTSS